VKNEVIAGQSDKGFVFTRETTLTGRKEIVQEENSFSKPNPKGRKGRKPESTTFLPVNTTEMPSPRKNAILLCFITRREKQIITSGVGGGRRVLSGWIRKGEKTLENKVFVTR